MTLTEYTEIVATAKLLDTPLVSVLNPQLGQKFVVIANIPHRHEIVRYIRPHINSPNWHWFQLWNSSNEELFVLEQVMPYEPERNPGNR